MSVSEEGLRVKTSGHSRREVSGIRSLFSLVEICTTAAEASKIILETKLVNASRTVFPHYIHSWYSLFTWYSASIILWYQTFPLIFLIFTFRTFFSLHRNRKPLRTKIDSTPHRNGNSLLTKKVIIIQMGGRCVRRGVCFVSNACAFDCYTHIYTLFLAVNLINIVEYGTDVICNGIPLYVGPRMIDVHVKGFQPSVSYPPPFSVSI